MGTTTIYLLPEDSSIVPDTYRSKVKSALLKMGVIGSENYNGNPDWHVAGENSLSPFGDPGDMATGFEYSIIYASPNIEVVPQDPAVEPACPSCEADLSESYYDLVNDIEELYDGSEKSQQYFDARLECPKCGRWTALPDLNDETGIFLSGTWVNFEDVPSPLRLDWLAEFESRTGWKHKSLVYWHT